MSQAALPSEPRDVASDDSTDDEQHRLGGVTARRRAPSGHGLGDDFFMAQPSRRADLPDPEPLLTNLARCILEVLAGARELEQLNRWVTDDVYATLLHRTVLAERARRVKGQKAVRPALSVLSTHVSEPCDGVVEATVIVRNPVRVRAVAIRLEGLDRRWRASAISVL
ncbi:Rv3235 family protein [Rathayibacter sp. KR2-224]|uniref:Rv3235 family protein n=1 Tax=Rathayibacter sp. KR2-224 TaxID=3400913 RepID=UPI003BFFA491